MCLMIRNARLESRVFQGTRVPGDQGVFQGTRGRVFQGTRAALLRLHRLPITLCNRLNQLAVRTKRTLSILT